MPAPHRRLTRWMAALLWLFPGQPIQGQPLQVDTNSSYKHQPHLETGPDDKTPVVNITAPGPDGVSRNVFEEYNVGEEGIIYNNNPDGAPGTPGALPPSYLAQFPLMVNPHLNGQEAGIILTEVSGFSPSLLQGYTEIYGHRADYILANPNGIYADGAGFINANRITLTTGLPQWRAGGRLRGFSVQRGVVEIRGKGMVTNVPDLPSSPVAIISRVVKLGAQLWAPDGVNIYTGRNDFNYHHQEATPRAGMATDRPHLAIDASLLGNIQAGKITLIATEQGVGVKAPQMLSAEGDITIKAAGPISLPQSVHSHHNISVTSDDLIALTGKQVVGKETVHLSGADINIAPDTLIYSAAATDSSPAVSLEANRGITSAGQIGNQQGEVKMKSRTLTNTGKIVSKGPLNVDVADTLTNEAVLSSADSLALQGTAINNSGTITGGNGDNKLKAQKLENTGTINSLDSWNIETDTLNNAAEIGANRDIAINARELTNKGKLLSPKGSLTLDVTESLANQGAQASIGSQKALNINAEKVNNNGTITGGEEDNKLKAQRLENTGTINSLRDWNIETETLNNATEAEIGANRDIAINARELTNKGHLLTPEGSLTIDVNDSITNEGDKASIGSQQTLTITTARVNNSGIITGGEEENQIKVENLDNSGTINSLAGWVMEAATLTNTPTGEISANGDIAINARELTNKGHLLTPEGSLTIDVTETITNEGDKASIGSQKALNINSEKVNNNGTITGGEEDNKLKAQRLENTGTINSLAGWNIETDTINNTPQGAIATNGDLTLTATQLTNRGKLLSPKGSLTIDVTETITNEGAKASIGSQKALNITTERISNSGNITGGEGDNKLKAQKLENTGTINSLRDWTIETDTLNNATAAEIGANRNIAINARELANQGHLLTPEGSLTIDVTESITNEGAEASIGSQQALNITTARVNNSGKITGGEGENKLKTTTIENSGTITRGIESKNSGTITRGIESNNSGTINGPGDWTIETATLTNTPAAEISADGNLTLNATRIANQGKLLSSEGSLTLDVTDSITNEGDKASIGSQQTLTITTERVNNSGTITGGEGENELKTTTIENTGAINSLDGWVMEAATLTNAPTGEISANGDLTLTARRLTNRGKLLSPGGRLTMEVTKNLANEGAQASIGSQKALNINTQRVTNSGKITGGNGQNKLKARTIDNTDTIDSLSGWRITADHMTQRGELSGNSNLVMHFDTLRQEGTIIGGKGKTELHVKSAFNNPYDKNITSQGALQVTVDGQLNNHGTMTSQGNLDVTTTAGKLINQGTIAGGEGTTTITAKGGIENSNTLQSKRDLILSTPSSLHNSGSINARHSLSVNRSSSIHNNNNATIAGGQGTTTLKSRGDIDNYNFIKSANNLVLISERGELYNQGKVASTRSLTVHAEQIRNQEGKSLLSGGAMTLNASKKIENSRNGKILSQGELTMQGRSGGWVAKIENHIGRIESMEDMTFKASVVENTGEVNFDPNPVISTRTVNDTPGDNRYALIREDYIESHDNTSCNPAHIKSSGTIHFLVKDRLTNRDSIINSYALLLNEGSFEATKNGNKYINGAELENITSSRTIPLPNGEYHENREEYTVIERTHEGVIVAAHFVTFGLSTVATVINGIATGEDLWESERTENRVLHKYEDSEDTMRAPIGAKIETVKKLHLKASKINNKYSTQIKGTSTASKAASLESLKNNPAIDVMAHIQLPEATDQHGLFSLNIFSPSASPAHSPVGTAPGVDQSRFYHPGNIPSPSPAHSPVGTAPGVDQSRFYHPGNIPSPSAPPAHFLVVTDPIIDQSRFYGSNYFMRQTGLDQAANKPMPRFLGDPFFESRMINEAILKATHNTFLNDDIATPEEQVKYLLDNSAEVYKDLNLKLGVKLSSAQAKNLKKDIICYEKRTVAGHEVLVPQLYLSQATIKGLSAPQGSVLRSRRGKVNIKSKGKVENIGGSILGQQGVAIDAKEIRNEGVGDVAARIASDKGAVSLHAKKDINNLSGEIDGATGTALVSEKGDIISETKLSADGKKMGPKAVLKSGGDLLVKGRDVLLRGSQVKAKGNGKIDASRDVKTTTVKTASEAHASSSSKSARNGFFSSSSKSSRSHKTTRKETHHGTDLDIGGNLSISAGRDADMVGTNVTADAVDMDVKGKTSIRAAYNSTDVEETTREEEKEGNWFSSERTTTDTTRRHGSTSATGNMWNVNNLRVSGQGDVDLEKMTVRGRDQKRAKKIAITSTNGDVRDHAGKEDYYDYTDQTTETERKGLFFGDSKKKKREQKANDPNYKEKGFFEENFQGGRLSIKLYERDKTHTDSREKGGKAAVSSFLTEDMELVSKEGRVVLEGTDVDASGTARFSGKKGVDILDAIESTEKSTTTHTEHEELSVGVRNKFYDAYLNAQDALQAKEELEKATLAYASYRLQLGQAYEDLQGGKITQEIYDEIAGKDAKHAAAIASATATVAAKTKQFTSSGVTALSAISSGGFSFDSELEIERAMHEVVSQYTKSKKASIKVGNLVIESEGNLHVRSSDIKVANNMTLAVQDVVTSASRHKTTERSSNSSDKTTTRGEIPLTGVGSNGNVNYTNSDGTGSKDNVQYAHSLIEVGGNTKLDVKGDMRLNRTQFVTSGEVEGEIGGDLVVETGLDSVDESSDNREINTGVSVGAGGYNPSVGVGYNTDSKKGTKLKEVSSFVSGGRMNVKVGGKVMQQGAEVGSSENSQSGIEAREGIFKEDVYASYNESNFGINGRLGATNKGGPKMEIDEESAYGKLDYGEHQLIQQATSEGKVRTIANTGMNLSLDSEAVKAVASPGETVQDIVQDVQEAGILTETIARVVVSAPKKGIYGTWHALDRQVGDTKMAFEMDKDGREKALKEAVEGDGQGMKDQLNNLAHEMQDRGGLEDKDKSQLVLVDDQHKDLKGRAIEGFEGAHDAKRKLMMVNTRKTDVSKVSSLLATTGHEVQRAENAVNPRLKSMSEERQEHMARSRGDNLARVHERLHGRERGNRAAVDAFHRRNKDFLNNSSSFAAKSKDKNLKPREYNWDRKTKKLTKVSEKGGDDLHYVHHGTTDENGNFVPEETTCHGIDGNEVSAKTKEQLETRLRKEGVDVLGVAGQTVGHAANTIKGAAEGLERAGGSWGKKLKHYKSGWRGNQYVRTRTGKQLAETLKNTTSRLGIVTKGAEVFGVARAVVTNIAQEKPSWIRSVRAAAEFGGGRVGGALGALGAGSLSLPSGPGTIAAGIAGHAAGAEIGSRALGVATQGVYEWFWERRRLTRALIRADMAREPSSAEE